LRRVIADDEQPETPYFDEIPQLGDTNAGRQYRWMIRTFRCRDTRMLFEGRFARGWSKKMQLMAARKLEILDAATSLGDLRVPPGNRLEKLAGSRDGQHSIRVNRQWRLCFIWSGSDAFDVELVDYH
jgi:toxin HigB-1